MNVTRADRHRLEAIISDRSAPQKHVWRANIILATADGCGTAEIMRRSGKSKPVVWRWQARFMAEGVEGLTRDKTRKPGKQPLPTTTVQRVVDLTLGPPPGEATHWTGRMLAKAAGVSLRSVQRILEAHQLAPHRIRTFKLSTDPKFAEKFKDVVGLYVDPPAHAVVLSVDEKSQIQALDRTQPGLPMKPGRAGTMTHDYKRHGTTTLFAALNILDGTVIGRNMQRHRHQEFIRFLNTIEAQVPVGKVIHAVVDNYATHKHPKVRQWLARHPRWTFHFTPTSASWLNAVEGFFAKLTRQRLRLIERVRSRDLDAALVQIEPSFSKEGLKQLTLFEDRRAYYAGESHPLAGKKSVTMKDIAKSLHITVGAFYDQPRAPLESSAASAGTGPTIELSGDVAIALHLLTTGAYIAALPEFVMEHLCDERKFIRLPYHGEMPSRTLSIWHRDDMGGHPLIKDFCHRLISYISSLRAEAKGSG